MTLCIDAAATTRVAPGTQWSSLARIADAGKLLVISHAAALEHAAPEHPAAMIDAFERRIRARDAASLRTAVERAHHAANLIGSRAADPLARSSLAALVLDVPRIAIARVGNTRVYIGRAGRVALVEGAATVQAAARGDVYVLCTAAVWTSVTSSSLARALARGRTAQSMLASITSLVPGRSRFAAIVARVGRPVSARGDAPRQRLREA